LLAALAPALEGEELTPETVVAAIPPEFRQTRGSSGSGGRTPREARIPMPKPAPGPLDHLGHFDSDGMFHVTQKAGAR
jgi:hypothetical protein